MPLENCSGFYEREITSVCVTKISNTDRHIYAPNIASRNGKGWTRRFRSRSGLAIRGLWWMDKPEKMGCTVHLETHHHPPFTRSLHFEHFNDRTISFLHAPHDLLIYF